MLKFASQDFDSKVGSTGAELRFWATVSSSANINTPTPSPFWLWWQWPHIFTRANNHIVSVSAIEDRTNKKFKKSISEILPPGIKSFRGCNSVTTGFCLVNFPQLHKMNKRNKIHKNEPNLSWELSPPAYCHKTWFFKTRTMLTKQLN